MANVRFIILQGFFYHLPMKKYFLAALLTFIASLTFAADSIIGKVVKVADGDTLTLLTSDKKQVRVRLAGIDCPESGQPWGGNATEALKAVLTGEPVIVEITDIDRYGRTVGRVYIKKMNINRHLVQSGNCWTYTRYAKDKELSKLQDEAKEANRGLWRLPEVERMPPWEWRKKNSR
ncbi:MAG: thermonuclease family protein [Pseudomonadales bacterium]